MITGKNLGICQRQYQEHWKHPGMGRYVPRCNSDGSFDKVQCHGSSCFCVDQNGNRKSGSFMSQAVSQIRCSDDGKTAVDRSSIFIGASVGRIVARCLDYKLDNTDFGFRCSEFVRIQNFTLGTPYRSLQT